VEIVYFNTDPLNNDTDGDGLLDGYEVSNRLVELWHSGIWQAAWIIDCGYVPEDTDPHNPDTDGDGLTDGEEFNLGFEGIGHSANETEDHVLWDGPWPTRADTDGDGLNDYQELQKAMQDGADYWKALKTDDLDGDGLSDYMEWLIGTWIDHSDYDFDTLDDGFEVAIGTDPLKADTDGDGLDDGSELYWLNIGVHSSDPRLYDTDGDGLNDTEEIQSYPETNASNPDTDGDGLSDYDEVKIYGTDPTLIDSDYDTLNDSKEIEIGTNPLNEDPDGDGLKDPIEIEIGTNPYLNDTDGDGLRDYYEWYYGTNPNNRDTDNDGLDDSAEKSKSTNPINPDTDGDGIPDGSDSTPGYSDYWNSAHYLPSIYVYPPSQKNHKPGEYVDLEVVLHGNVGTVNVTVSGPGKSNVSSFLHTGEGGKYEYLNISFLNFDGNSSVVTLELIPDNADPVSVDFNVINPLSSVNISAAYLPLNFPKEIYFNFTHSIKTFSLSIPPGNGSYELLEINNNSARVKLTMTERGSIKVKINAQLYNASHYIRPYTFIVGNDKFAEYETRLNNLLEKIRNYINISVDISNIRSRYYNGDESALEDLKSIIRVEALTLTAAVMLEQFVDDMANTAVDVISFKTLLNILVDKLKESETYKNLANYIVDKLNVLADKIVRGFQLDEGFIDNLVDNITEKAGECLDSTIQEYRDKLKNKFVEWLYDPLKNAHDSMVYTYLSENESRERRLKIYTYAEEGVGMINTLSCIKTVASSIQETSSLISSFTNGLPAYDAALEILEKAAEILANAAKALEKFEVGATIYNIIAAYKGEYLKLMQKSSNDSNYVIIFDTKENGDLLANYEYILEENYSIPSAIVDQIKISTAILRYIHGYGNMYMINSTSERYLINLEHNEQTDSKVVYVDAPSTVIANRDFNISVWMNFNASIRIGNNSGYGNNLTVNLSLEEGYHSIDLQIDSVQKKINITAVNISSINWTVDGDVLYYIYPDGRVIAVNAQDYNTTPTELLNETISNDSDNEDNTGSENETENRDSESGVNATNNLLDLMLPVTIAIAVIAAAAIIAVFVRKRKKNKSN